MDKVQLNGLMQKKATVSSHVKTAATFSFTFLQSKVKVTSLWKKDNT